MAAPYLAAASSLLNVASTFARVRAQRNQLKFQGKLSVRDAEQQALMFERDATVARVEAEEELDLLAFDVDTARQLFGRQQSRTLAQIGASGTEFSGSNLLVAIDQAREAELGIEAMTFISERRRQRLFDEAALLDFQAEQTRESGQFAQDIAKAQSKHLKRMLPLMLTSSLLGGASGILGSTGSGGGGQ